MSGLSLSGLSPAQVAAVTAEAPLLAVLAGPGSGKTRVLTRRVAWRCSAGTAAPAHVLVLTFSRRAASELYSRLCELGLPVGAGRGGVVAGTFHGVAWQALARHAADRGRPAPVLTRPGRLLSPIIRRVLGRDPWPGEIASTVTALGRVRRGLAVDSFPDVALAEIGQAYEEDKRRRRVLDLDDLLEECAALFESDRAAAEASRWRHRHLFVDEYQDLTPAHHRLIRAWYQDDLCLVGDPDQAVYGFNGAVVGAFERAGSEWPGIEVVRLPDNFRSTPEVVAVASAVTPNGAAGGGAGGASTRPPGPLPVVRGFADEAAEAAAVAAAVSTHCRPGRAWSGLAVLARTNARLRVVAGALSRAGIPWRLRDSRPLTDRPGARDLLAAVSPAARLSELATLLTESPPDPDRDALLAAMAEYPEPGTLTVSAFAAWLDASDARATEATAHGVELVTFHQAKGLEWPCVWVVGLEDGLVPLRSGDLDEEQRLLYVALTRAEDEISVSWAGPAGPSRWIAAIEEAVAVLAAAPPPPEQQARFAALRAGVDPAVRAVASRRDRLDAWRAARALGAGVAPAVILPDRVLSCLARTDDVSEDTVVRIGGRAAARWAPELARLLATA